MGKRKRASESIVKQATRSSRPQFSRSAMAVAVSLALTGHNTAVAAGEQLDLKKGEKEWGVNTELGYDYGNGGRHKGIVRTLVPLRQNSRNMTYFDGRVIKGQGNLAEGNLGIGHRALLADDKWILGGYGFYDIRRSESNENYQQGTLGFEALSQHIDLRANYYHPFTDKKDVGVANGGGEFRGNKIYANGIYEEALEGYDLEVGGLLPFANRFEPRVYAKYYRFDGDVITKDAKGWGVRFEVRPMQNIKIEARYEDDNLYERRTSIGISYSFGYESKHQARTFRQRMMELAERDIDIRETSALDAELRESSDSSDRVVAQANIVHVNNASALTGPGLGTAENPFKTPAACQALSCRFADVVYVHAGSADYTSGFTLANGQRLIGQGVSWYGVGGDRAPTLDTSGNAVVLGGNNEVAGFNLVAGESAIYGSDVGGDIYIHDNTMDSTDSAIALYARLDNFQQGSRTIEISNNDIVSGSGGIYIQSDADGAAQLRESISISGNRINSQGDGIELHSNVYGSGSLLSRNVSITGNAITAGSQGMYIDANSVEGDDLGGLAGFRESLLIAGNQIDSSSNGIELPDNEAHGLAISQRNVMIRDNVIRNTGGDAIDIDEIEAHDGARNDFNLAIVNNRIDAPGSDGIYIDDSQAIGEGSLLNRNVLIVGNTIRADDEGIKDDDVDAEDGGVVNSVLVIRNNLVQGDSEAIEIDDSRSDGYGSVMNREVRITDNVLLGGDSGEGILIDRTRASDEGTFNDDVFIGANRIVAGDQGIEIDDTYAEDDAVLYRDIVITGNTIVSQNQGVFVDDLHANSGGVVTDNMTITHNRITSEVDGLAFGTYNAAYVDGQGSILNRNLVIGSNVISAEDNGVNLGDASISSGGVFNDQISIGGNVISAAYNAIHADSIDAEDAGSIYNRKLTIANNAIDAGGRGYLTEAFYVDGGAHVGDQVSVSGNTIDAVYDALNFGDGYLDGAGTTMLRSVVVDNNVITSEDADGVDIDSIYVSAGGALVESLVVTNNTIAVSDSAIETDVYADSGGAVRQTVVVRNNTLSGDEAIDLDVYGSGFAVQQATITGNTIVSSGAALNMESESVGQQAIFFDGNTISAEGGNVEKSGPGTCTGSDC